MIQTGLIQSAHDDLVTNASYDFYGQRLATCSLDQRIKIWQLDESTGNWSAEDDWKAHNAAVSKVSWAHPEFGSIIASSSFDRTVKIWEQSSIDSQEANGATAPAANAPGTFSSRWVERAVLLDARGTVRAVEFAPHHFGLKVATISTDNHLRIYECLEQPSLQTWSQSEEIDVLNLPSTSSQTSSLSLAFATPTQTSATLDGASATLVAQALQQSQSMQGTGTGRPGLGNREADGGWCISWCKERYWGEVIAVGCGTGGIVKIIQISPSRRPTTLLTLDTAPKKEDTTQASYQPPPPAPSATATDSETTPAYAVTSVSWAPSCGRSYHLIAAGSRDGHVRIWKVKPFEEDDEDDEGNWAASIVADFDHHKSAVTSVEWNITGTVLSSAGNDGRIRLWKATSGNVWRPAGSIGIEQAEELPDADVDMDQSAGGS